MSFWLPLAGIVWKGYAAGAIGDSEAQELAEATHEGRHGPPLRLQAAFKRKPRPPPALVR